MTMVPEGSNTVDGKETPLQGLAAQTMGLAKMMPLASITMPDTNEPFKILLIVAQISLPWETWLASTKAVEGAKSPAIL
jgi:hypothetical protein